MWAALEGENTAPQGPPALQQFDFIDEDGRPEVQLHIWTLPSCRLSDPCFCAVKYAAHTFSQIVEKHFSFGWIWVGIPDSNPNNRRWWFPPSLSETHTAWLHGPFSSSEVELSSYTEVLLPCWGAELHHKHSLTALPQRKKVEKIGCKKLKGWNKNKDITHQLPSWAKQIQCREREIYIIYCLSLAE